MTLPRAGSRSVSEPSTDSLTDALNALCAELGIPFPEMLRTVEEALGAAYVRAFSPPGIVTVKLDTTSGALDVQSRLRDAARGADPRRAAASRTARAGRHPRSPAQPAASAGAGVAGRTLVCAPTAGGRGPGDQGRHGGGASAGARARIADQDRRLLHRAGARPRRRLRRTQGRAPSRRPQRAGQR